MPKKKSNSNTQEDPEDDIPLSALLNRKKGKKELQALSTGTTSITPPENPVQMESLTIQNEASVTIQRKSPSTPRNKPSKRKAVSTPKRKRGPTNRSRQPSSSAVPAEKNQAVLAESSRCLSASQKKRKLDFNFVPEVGLPTIKEEESPNKTLIQSKDYLPISSLKEAQREWTIKVKVLRKGTVDKYNSIKGSGMYQKYLLQDDKGVVIQGTSFNENIAKVKDQLHRGMTYYLSNGFIKSINRAFANAHESIEIMFGPTTCIEPAESQLQDATYSCKFIEFEDLQAHMGPSSTIDVIGIVVGVQPLVTIKAANTDEQLYKREVTLSNLRSRNIVFTLWADLATEEGETLATLASTKPVIAISKAKVVDKNGSISISSLVITTIEIEPKILDCDDMKKWRDSDHQLSTSEYKGIQLNTPYEELKLNDLITRDFTAFKHSYCCFRGEIIAITNENAPFYNACNNCNKKVEKESTECTNCSTKDTKVTQRYMLKLNVEDDTKKAAITLFDVAEKIIGCPPNEFYPKMDLKGLTGRTFIFTVRVQKSNDTLRKAGRFVAHDVQPVEE